MSAQSIREAAAQRGLTTNPKLYIDGDGPGFYAAVCDECVGADLGSRGCGETRYFKRDAKADLAYHQAAHEAWTRGERRPAWPA